LPVGADGYTLLYSIARAGLYGAISFVRMVLERFYVWAKASEKDLFIKQAKARSYGITFLPLK